MLSREMHRFWENIKKKQFWKVEKNRIFSYSVVVHRFKFGKIFSTFSNWNISRIIGQNIPICNMELAKIFWVWGNTNKLASTFNTIIIYCSKFSHHFPSIPEVHLKYLFVLYFHVYESSPSFSNQHFWLYSIQNGFVHFYTLNHAIFIFTNLARKTFNYVFSLAVYPTP